MWAAVEGESDWTRVVTSPMSRCREFAEALAVKLELPIEVDPRIKEVGFGAWEGRRHHELRAQDEDAFLAFYRDPVHARPRGAEPLPDFVDRVHAGLNDLLEDGGDEEHILVVAHAGVLRAAIMLALDAPLATLYRMHVPFAGRARLRRAAHGLELDLPARL
jgi:probable phosphoglycerate mutase